MNLRTLIVFAAASLPLGSTLSAKDAFSIQDQPKEGWLDILEEGKIVGRYMYGQDKSTKARDFDTAKTYLHVFDAAGKAPITKGAGGELPHHRGIFIGWNKLTVNGTVDDLWHMKGSQQLHEKFVEEKSGPDGASVSSLIFWQGKAGGTLIEEKRTMTFSKAPSPAYAMIDFSSTLTAVAGDVKLDGDAEHSGLQYRPSDQTDRKRTRFLFPVEKAEPKRDLDYPWVAESYGIGDKTYSVVYLNHPENLSGTRFSAYRDYGRFGAFFKGEIPKGKSITLKTRFLISEGDFPETAWIQEQSNAFTGKKDPAPKTDLVEAKPMKAAPKPEKQPEPAKK